MANEVASGVVQGAAAGAAVGGPVGAVIGGVIGGIKGLFGSKANKYKKKANREQRAMAEREGAVQRRDLIRQFRIARAQTISAGASETGGLTSSAPVGAAASISSQAGFNLNFFNRQVASQSLVNKYLNKADKYEGYASLTGSLFQAGATLYGSGVFSKGTNAATGTGAPTSSLGTPESILDYSYGSSSFKTYPYDGSHRL